MTIPGPFARLRRLLDGVSPPAGVDPLALDLGEVQLGSPPLDPAPFADVRSWSRYPTPGGTPALRAAYEQWLDRRFGVRVALRAGRIATEPTPGTKQAVATAIALAVRRAEAATPIVALPNPFYHAYLAAVQAAGARPVWYDHDLAGALKSAGGRAAAIVVCHPGLRGDVLSVGELAGVSAVARTSGALLVVDECYIDLWQDRAPTGFLSLAENGTGTGRFLVLHSLSKRSAAPGLRSGCLAGDRETVAAYAHANRSFGVSTPNPICAVAAALWSDDAHVAELRSRIAANWALADEFLRDLPGYRRAQAGFFLWLPVRDDEQAALALWRCHGLRVMPGRYLAVCDGAGVNPGAGFVRIALVAGEVAMREAFSRLRTALADRQVSQP